MEKIKVKRNSIGDTRTATRVPTFWELKDANALHIEDVKHMMGAIAGEIAATGRRHDFTKVHEPEQSLFYRELCAKIEGKIDSFTEGEWYPMHCKTERHHINEHCPDDVNLIDVLEMICDCCCAGMARSGSVRPVTISSEILQKAVKNTVDMCVESIEIVDE